MSSMVKKKGALAKAFKPRAPQTRRTAPVSTSSSGRPSTEPTSQSQTPAPITAVDASNSVPAQDLSRRLTDEDHPQQFEVNSNPQSEPLADPSPSTNLQDVNSTSKIGIVVKRKVDADKHTPSAEEVNPWPPTKKTRTLPSQSAQSDRQQSENQPTLSLENRTTRSTFHQTTVQPAPIASVEELQASATSQSINGVASAALSRDSHILVERASQTPDTLILDVAGNILHDATTREGTQKNQPEVDLSAMGPGQASGRSHIVPSAVLNPDGSSGLNIEQSPTDLVSGKKPTTKRRKIQPQDGDARATIEIQLHRPKRATSEKRIRKKKDGERKKRNRASTPDGAEDETLPAGITMGDLCKDLRIGKKFSKHDEIRQKDNQRRMKARLTSNHPELVQPEASEDQVTSTGDATLAVDESAHQSGNASIRMKVVDGNIVVEESSLSYDRHVRPTEVQEVVEENEFTRLLTSGTYMKRERAQAWTLADTELFYKCLRSYGTDFEMIATNFPNRSRRQIKLKFNAEERSSGDRITRVLTGTPEPIDMEEHQSRAGFAYEEVADIEAEAREKDEAHQAAQQKELDQQAEETRKKKAEIHAKSGNSGLGDSAKENDGAGPISKSRKKGMVKKAAKLKHSVYGGGEEVEVLGTVKR